MTKKLNIYQYLLKSCPETFFWLLLILSRMKNLSRFDRKWERAPKENQTRKVEAMVDDTSRLIPLSYDNEISMFCIQF